MKNYLSKFAEEKVKEINQSRGFVIPDFKAGDSVDVKYKITEGGNVRVQSFKGVVIARTKKIEHYAATFTVRKISGDVGVERKFLIHSPLLTGIEVSKQGSVRRSKLYYLRQLTGKASRIKEKTNFLSTAE